jgi:hypothetical protein
MKHAAPVVRLLAAIALVAVLSTATVAQSEATPDLSGTWILNPAKSKVSKKVAPDPEMLVIKCAGASIAIATSSSGKQSLEMFIVDGKEHIKDLGAGARNYTKAEWKKSVLSTEFAGRVVGYAMGNFDVFTVKQRWSLSSDGLTLTSETEAPKEIYVYDKK